MLFNVLLAVTALLVLISAGAFVGKRLLSVGPFETQVMAGVGCVILWAGAGTGLAIIAPGPVRLWLAVVAVPVLAVAVPGVGGWRLFLESPAVWASVTLVGATALMMAAPYAPNGEIDAGAVFATRIPGRPADNRLPYRTVQFIVHELDPDETEYFLDWGVTDRPQLAAGPAALVVALAGIDVPEDPLWYRPGPEVGFAPVDPHGYWAVRSVLIALNGLLPLGVAALAAPWFDRRTASVASVVAAMTVFGLVETAYTWPKFVGVAVACAAGGALLLSRPMMAGVLAGAASLFHPVAALLIPAVAWLAWRRGALRARGVGVALAAAAIVVFPWVFWVSVVEGETSRMTLYPIGWAIAPGDSLRDVLPDALEAFWSRFPLGVLHDRWISLRESLDVRKIFASISSGTPRVALFMAYDRTLPGMLGLAALVPFGAGLYASARERAGVISTGAITLGTALLMWGISPRALGADTLQPLVPILAIGVALGLCRHPRLRWFLPLLALESFVVVDLTLLVGDGESWRDAVTTAAYATALVIFTLVAMRLIKGDLLGGDDDHAGTVVPAPVGG